MAADWVSRAGKLVTMRPILQQGDWLFRFMSYILHTGHVPACHKCWCVEHVVMAVIECWHGWPNHYGLAAGMLHEGNGMCGCWLVVFHMRPCW